MSTKISDLIVPSVFAPYMLEEAQAKNALLRSGIVVVNAAMSAKLLAGGEIYNAPSVKNIADGLVGNRSDDSDTKAVPNKVSTRMQTMVRVNRNFGFGASDLAGSLAGIDPLAAVAQQAAGGIETIRNSTLKNVIDGVLGAVSTNVNDTTAGLAAGETAPFSADALIDTKGAWGDKAEDKLTVLLMNSATYRGRQKEQASAMIPASDTPVGFRSYLQMPVLVDDSIANGVVYLVQAGAIEFGLGAARVPVEVERSAASGMGGGEESLWVRDVYSYHVAGTQYVGTTNPSEATLASAASWTPVFDAKNIGLAQYRFSV